MTVAASSPTHPPSNDPITTPVKAPPSSMPSIPILTTPERSHKIPDNAPKAIGVARAIVDTSMLISENSSPAVAQTISENTKTAKAIPSITVVLL